MPRFYKRCSTCGRRMRLIGKSSETFGQPPTPSERYYRCPRCGAEWTIDIERNFLFAGVPDHLTQDSNAALAKITFTPVRS
jgi:DNA-directed RNA polymerase subunit RPC12/RpoP